MRNEEFLKRRFRFLLRDQPPRATVSTTPLVTARRNATRWARAAIPCALGTVPAFVACSTPMRIVTGNPAARVLVDGATRGRGEEVTVSEPVSMGRRYRVEARVTSNCRDSVAVDAKQNPARVAACMLGSVFGGAAGAAAGTTLASDGDNDAAGTAALAGAGLGGLLGLICLAGGYEAPEMVELDTSHCRHKP